MLVKSVALALLVVGALLGQALPASAAVTPPDTMPTITSPSEDELVGGVIDVQITSSAPYVRVLLDQPWWPDEPVVSKVQNGSVTVPIPTYGYEGSIFLSAWDCADPEVCHEDGPYSIRVNVSGNAQPALTAPTSGQEFDYWNTLHLAATAPGGSVRFRVNGHFEEFDPTPPYKASADMTTWPDGQLVVEANLCSASGLVCAADPTETTITLHGFGLVLPEPENSHFSPNGDGTQDTLDVNFSTTRVADLNFSMANSNGDVVADGPLASQAPEGTHVVTLDGTDGTSPLPDGEYEYTITASDPAHPGRTESVETGVVIDRRAPTFAKVTQSRSTLYPFPDKYQDSVTFAASSKTPDVTQRLAVISPSGAEVYSRTSKISTPTVRQYVWKGESNSHAVRPGTYEVRWQLTDLAGNVTTQRDHLRVHDEQLTSTTVPLSVDGMDASKWAIGKCSTVHRHRGNRDAADYLSDSKCDSRPYESNRKHVIVGIYRVRVPKALDYGGAKFLFFGGSLGHNAVAWESVWSAKKNKWKRANFMSSEHGRHVVEIDQPGGVFEGHWMYMAVVVGAGSRYEVDHLEVQLPCLQLLPPSGSSRSNT